MILPFNECLSVGGETEPLASLGKQLQNGIHFGNGLNRTLCLLSKLVRSYV